ncbi:TlpA disulfide reductase family protein [Mucilaginibacter sabulilitoris]|uniref:TlpA disulfide reductase family protein n=1 Tax=Mucilaginibacter sabulilitoris TaxID=1173583 RepID=A0ABZ0TSS7_9SPHI|nr:TlpA disulfide reductase family protein [Mucilaginibacter sabulilitoris]WPU94819.1 TlpA disulfide reductase family protein [Mucilaginibacter sabulilitoris]
MFKKILYLIFTLPQFVLAQGNQSEIQGKAPTIQNGAKVYLVRYEQQKKIVDSASIKQGAFNIKVKGDFPVLAYIFLNKKGDGLENSGDMKNIYLEEGVIKVSILKDSIKYSSISGNRANEDYEIFIRKHEPISNKYDSLSRAKDQLSSNSPIERRRNLDSLLTIYRQQSLNVTMTFIKDHPTSPVSLIELANLTYTKIDIKEIANLFKNLSLNLKQTLRGRNLKIKIDRLLELANGTLAPNFSLPDIAGKSISLSSLKGNYVLLDFWASWCYPCRLENPNLVNQVAKYKGKNFIILGVSLDGPGNKEKWRKAIEDDHITWLQVSDLKGFKSPVAQAFNISGIPQNFLIDPDGKIIDRNLTGDALQKKLQELFNK